MNNRAESLNNKPGQQNPPVDKTFIEDAEEQYISSGAVSNQTKLNVSATKISNPYVTSVQARPTYGGDDILPADNQQVPLGSGTTVSILGSGGMARVYKIWNEKLEIYRAVKIVLPNQQKDLRNRFETEAKITAKLHHPNIVEIYNVGDWNGLPYLEMEYIDGQSLESLINSVGRLPPEVSCAICLYVARALAYAHGQTFLLYGKNYHGIIHRDLKPANIMIDKDGRVVLMDFGIARPTEASLHTVEGNIVGTLQYLSPEQIDGVDIDHRADIYAFGAILYELLTGTKVFPQDTITNLMKKKITNEYRKFSEFGFEVSSSLAKIAQKCLQFSKENRYANTEELLADLQSAYKSMTSESPQKIIKSFLDNPKLYSLDSDKSHSFILRPKIVIPSVLALVIIAGFVYFLLNTGPTTQPVPQITPPNNNKQEHPVTPPPPNPPMPLPSEPKEPSASNENNNSITITSESKDKTSDKTRGDNTQQISNKNVTTTKIKPDGTKPSSTSDQKKPPYNSQINPVETIVPTKQLTHIEELQQKYSSNDMFVVGTKALSQRQYADAIMAFKNTPSTHPNSRKATLFLLEAYINSGKSNEAFDIIRSENFNDSYFDILCGILYKNQGLTKKALEYFENAMGKNSIIKDRREILDDAAYYSALIRKENYNINPTADNRAFAQQAWRLVKQRYESQPDHPRFKQANHELTAIP